MRLHPFFVGLLALLTAALLVLAPAGAKLASGGYQLPAAGPGSGANPAEVAQSAALIGAAAGYAASGGSA
ncbi:MAG: hypothetical protein KGH84_01695, partial [Paracoccaceae bacterium]|nr:hypothetical protein [Paracoccaceae bacterium]